MEFEQILQLIDHVSASRLEGFCYESEDLKLTLNNKLAPVILPEMTGQTSQNMMQKVPQIISNSTMPADEIEQLSVETEPVESSKLTGNIVKSPLVGTFYVAPSEDAPAFVKAGDKVKKGQVLAIAEAMKLMNEIESDFDGEVVEIYVENGQPVEYGQPLFSIR